MDRSCVLSAAIHRQVSSRDTTPYEILASKRFERRRYQERDVKRVCNFCQTAHTIRSRRWEPSQTTSPPPGDHTASPSAAHASLVHPLRDGAHEAPPAPSLVLRRSAALPPPSGVLGPFDAKARGSVHPMQGTCRRSTYRGSLAEIRQSGRAALLEDAFCRADQPQHATNKGLDASSKRGFDFATPGRSRS